MNIEEKEILKVVSTLKEKKKIINIVTIVLVTITIIFSIIYSHNARLNNFYESEARQIERRKKEAERNVEDKLEEVRKYKNLSENSSSYLYKSLYETANKEYKEALIEAVEASNDYLETFGYPYKETITLLTLTCIAGIITALIIIFRFYAINMEVTVTDKRIYGKKAFGNNFNISINNISLISTFFLQGITIYNSSEKIHLICIKDRDEIYMEISKLLKNK